VIDTETRDSQAVDARSRTRPRSRRAGPTDARGAHSGRLPAAPAGVLALPAGLLVGIVVVPLFALVLRAITSPSFIASLTDTLVLQALRVTAVSTLLALALVVVSGTPLAYLLARRSFPGRRIVDVIVDLPLVLPPVVAGVALLMAFGRRGVLGSSLSDIGIELPFTLAAVVLAQVFVAGPFYVRSATAGFCAIDRAIEEAASIDGASTWASLRYVTIPLAAPGIASGAVLCFGRALSEFGATLLFAGNFLGRTQTMSLAIMQAMESDLSAALALAVLLVVAAAVILAIARAVTSTRFLP
jgi:molybdate transport system permease protein